MSKDLNATHFENIPTYPPGSKRKDRRVHAVIETVQGSAHKNALDSKFGIIRLKAVLPDNLHWPYDYGFIPQTLADDGDPLDIVFLVDRPTFPGALAEARVLGSVKLKKGGIENDRIIAAPQRMPGALQSTDGYSELADIPKEELDAIRDFLIEYSAGEGNQIEFVGTVGARMAMRSVHAHAKKFKKKNK